MMKNLVLIALFLFSLEGFAQFNNNNGGRGTLQHRRPVNSKSQKPPEFNVEKAIGLNFYDVEKVLNKMKIKNSDANYTSLVSLFENFNKELKDYSRINSFSFSEAKKTIEAAQKKSMDSQDYSFVQKAYLKIIEDLKPAINLVKEKNEELDKNLKGLLSEKQFSKWEKYKKKQARSRS